MTNDVLINMNKVQKHLKEIADNARDNGYSHEVEVIQSVQDNLLDFVEESRSALAPVDVEGLKRETSKMLLEHLQKTWYQGIQGMSFEQFCVNSVIDHLAACGFGVPEWKPIDPKNYIKSVSNGGKNGKPYNFALSGELTDEEWLEVFNDIFGSTKKEGV